MTMIEFTNNTVDSAFDWLASNPAWMAFIIFFVPLAILLVWVMNDDKKEQARHRRLPSSVQRDIQIRPRASDPYSARFDEEDFFDKVTNYYNAV